MYADAVIEGGGVKGIGLVGAICEAEKRGYQWKRLAGTSVGSIIATLLAAGYSATELKKEILDLDFTKFNEKQGIGKIPVIGGITNLYFNYGIYSSEYIEDWMRLKLSAKGVKTFDDLNKILYIIATDITNGEMLILPEDIKRYGIEPSSFDVARAVRMSCSIPYYFKPVKVVNKKNKKSKTNYIVDGGVLSNFPIWIFDQESYPRWPTFGFCLVSKDDFKPNKVNGVLSMSMAIVNTMLDARDKKYIEEQDYVRTIQVPTLGFKATDFSISTKMKDDLYISGVNAGKKFFNEWNFSQYAFKYRGNKSLD